MKRVFAIVLSIIVTFGFVACNNDNCDKNSGMNAENSFDSSGNSSSVKPTVEYPPVEEGAYPNNVTPVNGVNRYEDLKLESPLKTVSVTEYQNYAIEQIEIYLNAIDQDESITYNTDYLRMELTKRKYAIYTQEDFDKIDLILIDAENLLKKYILEDEILLQIEADAGKGGVKYYYGSHDDMYFIVLKIFDFSGYNVLVVDNFYFCYTSQTEQYVFVWKADWDCDEYFPNITNAYERGLVSKEVLAELFPHEIVRLSNERIPVNESMFDQNYITASNYYNALQAEAPQFLINMYVEKNITHEIEKGKSKEIKFYVGAMYLDNFKLLPYGVTNVECGIVDSNGKVLISEYFSEAEPARESWIFSYPILIHYNRDGIINNVEYFSPYYFNVKEKLLLEGNGEWLRFYINLEYTNGYKETHYGEKLYYSIVVNKYNDETGKYYNEYTFSEKFIPQKK